MLRPFDFGIPGYKTSVSKAGVDKLPGTSLPLTFLPTKRRIAWTVAGPKKPERLSTDLRIRSKVLFRSGSLVTPSRIVALRRIGRCITESFHRRGSSSSPSGIFSCQRSSRVFTPKLHGLQWLKSVGIEYHRGAVYRAGWWTHRTYQSIRC